MPINLTQMPWTYLGILDKAAADADGALGVTERKYSFVKDLDNCVVLYPVPLYLEFLVFRFRGKTDGDNATIDTWMGRLQEDKDCDLFRVCTLDVETGTQVSWNGATNYTLFADEITVTNATSQAPVADATVLQSGNDTNFMARLQLPPAGNDLIVFHAHTGMANSVAIDYSGYSIY